MSKSDERPAADAAATVSLTGNSAPSASPSTDELVGTTLGRYRIIARIGEGGMGVVYHAEDASLHRAVAMKVLPAHLVGDPERRQRFYREARSAAAATHASIATIYDIGEHGAHVYLAMERVTGRTVRALLAEAANGLAIQEAARIACDVARGLAKAHSAGVIHRDLKPDNVMVDDDGNVKILDFGLAKLREAEATAAAETRSMLGVATEEGRILGTPSYMSPEQARGGSIDERSDVFSLGVMLYEMATGRRPFVGASTLDVLMAISRDAPAAPASLRAELPDELARIILRCIDKEPASRPQRAALLADELSPFVSGDGHRPALDVAARGPSMARRPYRRAYGVVAAAVLGLAALGGWRIAASRARPPAQSKATPLMAPDAVLACPMLEASDVDGPAGWLGAAAASIACERARVILGADSERMLVPALLLDLPRVPVEDFPADPFGAVDARQRSLARARSLGSAYLDGSIQKQGATHRVELVLRAKDDTELARGVGAGAAPWLAVRTAMRPLVTSGALPQALYFSADVGRWELSSDVAFGIAVMDCWLALRSGAAVSEECDGLAARKAELGPWWPVVKTMTDSVLERASPPLPAAPIDRSSVTALWATASAAASLGRVEAAGAIADELRPLRSKESSALARSRLAVLEAELRALVRDASGARTLVLATLTERPGSGWSTLSNVTKGQAGRTSTLRAHSAWEPDEPSAWMNRATPDEREDTASLLRWARRAFEVAPAPSVGSFLGLALVRAGKREEARAVAATLLAGPPHGHLHGEILLVEVEASEARFAAALTRARKLLGEQPSFGWRAYIPLRITMQLAVILGRAREVADEIVDRFVLAEPPPLQADTMVVPGLAEPCAFASPARTKRCFGVLGKVPTMHQALLEGADHYARGDARRAVAAWRPLLEDRLMPATIVVDALDRSGEPELADKVDARWRDAGSLFHGADLSHVRAARRAFRAKDTARAREMAQLVVDSWSSADETVSAVAEMRELLTKLR